jgi:FAD/FMN-containing dehydrogenase
VHGSLGNFVESLDLRTGLGLELHCSRNENPDVFWATIGGMGLTGVILRASIRLLRIETSFIRANFLRLGNLDQLLDQFVHQTETATYSVAWVDCVATGSKMGRSVLIRGEHASTDDLPNRDASSLLAQPRTRRMGVPFYAPNWLLNLFSVAAFNSLYYLGHPSRQRLLQTMNPFSTHWTK